MSFLSSNAQDFIEDANFSNAFNRLMLFLSSNAQDFIEDINNKGLLSSDVIFLSSNAQDFIEDDEIGNIDDFRAGIPEQ